MGDFRERLANIGRISPQVSELRSGRTSDAPYAPIPSLHALLEFYEMFLTCHGSGFTKHAIVPRDVCFGGCGFSILRRVRKSAQKPARGTSELARHFNGRSPV